MLIAALVLLGALALVWAAPRGPAQPAGTASLTWSVLGAGGGHAGSASYGLDDTLGQPLTGADAGTTVYLSAGFWQEYASYRVYVPQVSR